MPKERWQRSLAVAGLCKFFNTKMWRRVVEGGVKTGKGVRKIVLFDIQRRVASWSV